MGNINPYVSALAVILIGAVIGGILARHEWSKKSSAEKNVLFFDTIEKIKGYILDLIFDAERIYKSGTGQFKKAYVINLILNGEFYKGLPVYVQKMVSYSILSNAVDKIVDTVFNAAKKSNKDLQERLSEQGL